MVSLWCFMYLLLSTYTMNLDISHLILLHCWSKKDKAYNSITHSMKLQSSFHICKNLNSSFQWHPKSEDVVCNKLEKHKLTLLSMSRSRRSFTVQPAPLRRIAPHPNNPNICKSGSSPGIAAIAIDLGSKGGMSFSRKNVQCVCLHYFQLTILST
jgi:hypothetical protein